MQRDYIGLSNPAKRLSKNKQSKELTNPHWFLVVAASLVFGGVWFYYGNSLAKPNRALPEKSRVTAEDIENKTKDTNTEPELYSNSNVHKGWDYERLLLQNNDEESQVSAQPLSIESHLLCGTFNSLQRAQRLKKIIEQLRIREPVSLRQVSDKYQVLFKNLPSRRKAEAIKHKLLKTENVNCIIMKV
ncbi:MAG: hypothetical protein GJ680_21130 [Alteromonadaceae bacterium]|nr:hypothetical protein [Alteromonadaceae bacterium]